MTVPLLARVLRNWPLKLAALVLSLLVWVLVSAEETTSELVGVQLDLALPPTVALAAPLPPVRALVSGPGREILKLYATPLVIRAAPPANPGARWRLEIAPSDVAVTPAAAVSILDVQPREVLIELERLARRSLPVALRGPAPGTGVTLDSLALTPALVEVSGPRARVAELDSVATESLDVRDAGPFERRLAVDTTAYPLLRFEPRTVLVKGRLRRP